PGGETTLAPLWHDLAGHHLKRRGLVVILSDCFDNLEQLTLALRHFRHKRHEVLLFHVLAPEEMEFPYRKLTRFDSLETGPLRLLVDPARLRSEYLERFNDFCDRLRDKARQMRIDYRRLRTDEPIDKALGAYLEHRQRQM